MSSDRCIVVTTHVDQAWTRTLADLVWIVGLVVLIVCAVALFVSVIRSRNDVVN